MAHKVCQYQDVSGFGVVEVVAGYCEVGEGCDGLKSGCPFAWEGSDKKTTARANARFAEFCQYLEAQSR